MPALPETYAPPTWRELWRLTNERRPFDPRTVRLSCMVLALAYLATAVLRHDPAHPALVWARGVVIVYAAIGIVAAPRLGWAGLRAYTAALALLLPIASTVVSMDLGNRLTDIILTALVTFIPLTFVVTGIDLLCAGLALAAFHGAALAWDPPTAVPPLTAAGLLYGSLVTGVITGVVMIITRAGLHESSVRWQRHSERERLLREFAQVTSSCLVDPALFDRLAAEVLAAFGPGVCTIIVAEGSDAFRIVGAAAPEPDRAAALSQMSLPDALALVAREVLTDGRPILQGSLGEADRAKIAARWGGAIAARSLVALPIATDDGTAGLLVIAGDTPCDIDPDAVQLWQTMANQIGVALANRQLVARLEAALRAKSEFLNTMSHELRSPLHVVIGYADMLLETEADSPVAEPVGRMRAAALELLRLVEESMTAARLEGGRIRIRAEAFSAADLLAEVAENVRALPEAKRAAPVVWDVAPDIPPVVLDRLKVKEIVQNLVSNALKFSPEGGVEVRVARDGERLAIAVRDHGPGIPPEAQARIFEMFERIESPDGPRAPGVGLGLYIVRQLVQLMDGSIALESAPGRGTCFTVRLPLAIAEAA